MKWEHGGKNLNQEEPEKILPLREGLPKCNVKDVRRGEKEDGRTRTNKRKHFDDT